MSAGRRPRNNTPPKERLLTAAIRLFKKNGPNVTVDEICEGAECVRPALYGLFKGRTDLVRACLDEEVKAARGVNLGVIYPTIVDYTLKPRIESYVEKLCKESEREQSPIGLAALFLVGRTADEEIKKHAGLSVAKIIHEFAAGLYSLSGPQVEEAAEIFIGTVFHSFSIGLIVASSRAAKEVRELAVNNFFRSLPSKVTGDIFAAETDQAPAFALGRE